VYMAGCGVGSRRYCEQKILEGRVAVNGKIAVIGSKVSMDDRVTLDRRLLRPQTAVVYLVVNKPRATLCANSDSRGRPLVLDLLDDIPVRIYHVGRLDFHSSGLIFYTNDGRFAKIVTHPSSEIEKEYLIEAGDNIQEQCLKEYRRGLDIAGQRYRLKRYVYKTPRKVVLTLIEGKNKEIRRVFEHFRIKLLTVHRIRIGCVRSHGIPAGGYRSLSRKEVSWFLDRGKKG